MSTARGRASGTATLIVTVVTLVVSFLTVAGAGAAPPDRDHLRQRLLARGHSAAVVDDLRTTASYPGLNGIRHVRLQQRVGGLDVYGGVVRAALAPDGRVVNLIDGLDDASGPVRRASVGAATAVRAAGGGTATMVAIARGGHYAQGYLVETWTAKNLRYTLVDGAGRVVSVENRTASDSYNVFVEDPLKGPQTVVSGQPGWLGTASQSTHHISGNNVDAYLDTDNDNAADSGGTAVTDGNFLATANFADDPSTDTNQSVSVQNLFYLNNVVHDVLYAHGFTEAAGNFEADGGDAVQAEAQDGGGVDNANFSTPADGTPPRMQMYLWTPASGFDVEVRAQNGTFGAFAATFGPALPASGLAGEIAAAVPADGCTPVSSAVAGKIAVIDRGSCDFVDKVKNATRAKATAVIVVNNVAGPPFPMGAPKGSGKLRIPSAMISQDDGTALRSQVPQTVTLAPIVTTVPLVDGSVDADIVFHEYGHGLTWRMIGGMIGPMASAVGEGASDVLAMMINGDDRIAEYAFSNPGGLRRDPYAGYPRTYGDVTGTEEHDDGEIYAAIGWRLIELYGANRDHLFDLWIDGMNYTPATPAFEDMRDGMLEAATDPADDCLIWQAFAQFGVGVGASHTTRGKQLVITESFTLPEGC